MTIRKLPASAHLVPKNARRVFSGQIFDVYQWPQQLFDGSIATFEMLKRPDTVVVIALDDDDTVVVQDEQQPGGISRRGSVPVGRVDASDASVLAAAKREFAEETGLELASWKLLRVTQPEAKIEWFIHTFVACNVTKRGTQHLDAGEQITSRRQPFSEFREGYVAKYTAAALPFDTAAAMRSFIEA